MQPEPDNCNNGWPHHVKVMFATSVVLMTTTVGWIGWHSGILKDLLKSIRRLGK